MCELVIVDTETANLRGGPRLLELGALRIVDGVAREEFHALVHPGIPIDPAASAIHGIHDHDLVLAEEPRSALERFDRWRGTAPLVAHNASFDARVLERARARCGLAPSTEPWFDSLRLARVAAAGAPNHRLATLVRHFELGAEPPHRALADARACAAVVAACLRAAGLPSSTHPLQWPGRSKRAIAAARPES